MGRRRRRVEWSERAYETLDEVIAHVAADSPQAAARLLVRLFDAAESLAELTERGRIVPEFDDPTVRELIVPPYRVLYEHGPDDVRILSLVHTAQAFRVRRSELEGP